MPFSQIQKELAGSAGSQVYDFLSTPKQYVVDKAFGWWNDALLRGRQDELLKALTAPDVQARIAKLKQLTPNSRKFIETFSVMTALVAGKIEPGRLPERAQGQIAPQQMTAPAQP